jgi:anti-sigma regulatory factor (Ser/Thr protein kinase)
MTPDQLSAGRPGRRSPSSGDDPQGRDMRPAIVLGTMDIPAEAGRVKAARHWLRDLLGEDHPAVFEVELLGSELITNSILHSDSARLDDHGRPGTVSIVVLALAHAIRVEVTDAGSARGTPHVVDAGTDALNGRGLHLLQEITGGRCGTWADQASRTVWFQLDHPSEPDDRNSEMDRIPRYRRRPPPL